MINRVAHFEIHAGDPERAIAFYKNVFGWDIQKWENDQMEYWMVMTGDRSTPGINGGLVRRKGPAPTEDQPMHGYACTIMVEDYDSVAAKAVENGATVTVEKFNIADMGYQGYFKDTEGNVFGLHQEIKKA